jgi:hypothetical protein
MKSKGSELSPADDGCWPPFIAPGLSMLNM